MKLFNKREKALSLKQHTRRKTKRSSTSSDMRLNANPEQLIETTQMGLSTSTHLTIVLMTDKQYLSGSSHISNPRGIMGPSTLILRTRRTS